jgi:voltage-gated potassium channel
MIERSAPMDKPAIESERRELLERIENWLEVPMLVLGFLWLILLGIELLWERVWERNPLFSTLSTAIWIVFIVNFTVELILAPRKLDYFKRNWLTVLSLIVPALRVFRIFRVIRLLRAARAVRGLRLVRVLGSLNRGMRALGASMGRRGFGYVVALTVIVTASGAAGMYAFENDSSGGLSSYGEALWWTAMLMTTMGSAYWPQSPEGRVLCIVLALYAFAIFGYVTAALATYFVGRDAEADEAEVAGAKAVDELKQEIVALRAEIAGLAQSRQRRPRAREKGVQE